MRAAATESSIRPAGLTKTSQEAPTHHHEIVGAALHTDAIKAVVQVAWDDLVAHYRLVKLRVEALGPLVVAIDAHGGSLFDSLGQAANDKLPEIMAELERGRAAFAGKR